MRYIGRGQSGDVGENDGVSNTTEKVQKMLRRYEMQVCMTSKFSGNVHVTFRKFS